MAFAIDCRILFEPKSARKGKKRGSNTQENELICGFREDKFTVITTAQIRQIRAIRCFPSE